MSRQEYGAGTLTPAGQQGKRKRWRVRVYLGPDPLTGKPRQVERTVYGTARAAEQAQRQLAEDVKAGRVGQAKGRSGRGLGDVFDEWLTFVRRDKAPNTFSGYRSRVEARLRPKLGAIKLDRLDVHTLDRYFNELAEQGLKPSTVRQDYITLSAALSQAVRWGWLDRNPARMVTLPRDDGEGEAPALTLDQVRALHAEAMKEETADLALAIVLGAATGMRRGELLGLQWGDVDWQLRSIRIARQRTPGPGGDQTRALKNARGKDAKKKYRVAWLDPACMALLELHYDAKRELLGQKPDDDGWVLSYDGGRTPISSTSLTEHFRTIAKRAGIRATLHSLRHYASDQVQGELGADVATAAQVLGNTRAVLASTYSHPADERSRRVGTALSSLVAAALGAVVAEATPADAAELPQAQLDNAQLPLLSPQTL